MSKTLRVRVAEFVDPDRENEGLEAIVRGLLEGGADRTATLGDKVIYRLNRRIGDDGIALHLVVFTPDDPATSVHDPSVAGPDQLVPVAPPRDSQFVDATLNYLISGSDIVCCRSGTNSDGALVAYVTQAATSIGLDAGAHWFHISDRADINKLQALQRQGIKSLSFNARASQVAFEDAQRDTTRQQFLGAVLDQVNSLLGGGIGAPEPNENMLVDVSLKLDGRYARLVDDPALMNLAERALREGEEGFRIVTGEDQTITADDVILKRSVEIEHLGKHPSHTSAWGEMRRYLRDLRQQAEAD